MDLFYAKYMKYERDPFLSHFFFFKHRNKSSLLRLVSDLAITTNKHTNACSATSSQTMLINAFASSVWISVDKFFFMALLVSSLAQRHFVRSNFFPSSF